ncbi:DUF2252 domain-containing protein [Sediminicoccus sp. KRV36]|uniref:DUF2252 domain-containing protein n=1 Tax=Sediminicoccus sp. KRV36 TaxID=3133721 RepID=UPI00200E0AED|nr:DUF2252 domain-containing protein [Sediminicoccus rosea]UPY36430.1 DUF2252 domain-containing protein [Sediminicoccus rosea]
MDKHHLPERATPEQRIAAGKALRDKLPRPAHAPWKLQAKRGDAIAILQAADKTRLPELVPIRYGRMLQTPFTFYRGSAAIMAKDLSSTPSTGIHVQACGDAHLMNFGGFATPERRLVFDINDLDETLPAPWEWDVKRLVASFVLAARSNDLSDDVGRDAAMACAKSYRKRMRDYAGMDVLDTWYARIDANDVLDMLPPERRDFVRKRIGKATEGTSSELIFPKLVDESGGRARIRDEPPLLFHWTGEGSDRHMEVITEALGRYRESLAEDRRVLFDRYELADGAMKVVGIGSVGTFCMVLLFTSLAGDPLFLQVKQANASVLEPYAGASAYKHHGQRVVMGQRLMQPASDIFLGWVTGRHGRDFYVRQLRDVKLSPLVETFDAEMLELYGELCGWALARAHAKAGDPWSISGYLGNSAKFDDAMGDFALAYADQAERDHAALKAAVRAGKIAVEMER